MKAENDTLRHKEKEKKIWKGASYPAACSDAFLRQKGRKIRNAADMALRLLYPPRCPICDRVLPLRDGLVVCEGCRDRLPWAEEPVCMKCGKPVGDEREEYCEDCRKRQHIFDQGRAAFTYTGKMRRSVYRMKHENRRDYLDFYADAMVKAAQGQLVRWRPDVIVPVPAHWRKRIARGYNQAELLAQKVSGLTGIPCDRELLRCIRFTGEQKKLGRRERLRNLRGSFETKQSVLCVSSVLLIDDIYTTGSTLDEAARVLKRAGADQVFFLVLCTGTGKKRYRNG